MYEIFKLAKSGVVESSGFIYSSCQRYTETYGVMIYAMYGETVFPNCQADWIEKC